MSDNPNEGTSTETDKPAPEISDAKFPPFPDPTDKDFEDDVPEEERNYYKTKFPDLNTVKYMRLHCTACDRHLGSSARNISRMRAHPMLRALVCHTCHTFYNSGEFEKGDDGSELYCRWCGQGGQVYCCSNCPHVFCAKCIKRNLGPAKIKEIENKDDWKCFKCCPESLKELRAVCWAILRYCDLKNEMTYKTEDPQLKEIFQKECTQDYTDCCKHKNRRRSDVKKKEEKKVPEKPTTSTIIPKLPSTIQVKKFASINPEEVTRNDKKVVKRSVSPKQKPLLIKNPMTMPQVGRLLNPIGINPPPAKKMKMMNHVVNPAVKFNDKFMSTLTRIRPRAMGPPLPVVNNFNGFNNPRIFTNVQNMVVNDNINLSLESLTQGIDMATVAAMSTSTNPQNDDVVCTPDFPMEPVCEVTEDNDDDVQCITPNPTNVVKNNPPPLIQRSAALPEIPNDNIVQMTENDVTVNTATGGLKFRVDPQTLSSNKMYRLPDGRVFAINANPSMPGGYSATIVAVTESAGKLVVPQGLTYSAKLSAVSNSNTSTPVNQRPTRETRSSTLNARRNMPKRKAIQQNSSSRECDLNVPVEWYRHNLIDAVDALEFSLSRLNKLKKDTNSMYLRTRTLGEMRSLHRNFERILNTSSKRFLEIKDSLNKEMKQYVTKKMGEHVSDDEDDDDDVEILPNLENDDPIFIDENSVDSNVVEHVNPEMDLTGGASCELNSSGEKEQNKRTVYRSGERCSSYLSNSGNISIQENSTTTVTNNSDPLQIDPVMINNNDKENEEKSNDSQNDNRNDENDRINLPTKELICDEVIPESKIGINQTEEITKTSELPVQPGSLENLNNGGEIQHNGNKNAGNDDKIIDKDETSTDTSCEKEKSPDIDGDTHQSDDKNLTNDETLLENEKNSDKNDIIPDNDEKLPDAEISDEMIENLLKDDNDAENAINLNSSDDVEMKEI